MPRDLVTALKQSKANRLAMEQRFGFVPLSILDLNRGALSASLFSYREEHPERNVAFSDGAKEKAAQLAAVGVKQSISNQIRRGTNNVMVMAAELVDFFVKYYTKPGATYLNPFMGKGIEMQVAKLRGLHFYGYDIAAEFFPYTLAIKDKIDDGKTTINLTCGDSRYPTNVPDNCGDFAFYSPPYWKIETYGDEPGQIGFNVTYPEFLANLYTIAAAWLPKFKSGAWIVVNVNDFRIDGQFYPYHANVIDIYTRAGYAIYDTWIVEGLIGGTPKVFAVDFNQKRMAPKIHEYCLVFRKP